MAARRNPNLVVAPRTPTSAPTSPAAAVSASNGDRKRILLVEGDGFTRLVLLLRLRLAGFVVEFTSNGILGLGKLRHCRPDILLVELKLCGLSGLELIKSARAEPGFGDRPIYVYTHAEKMSRHARKEVGHLATELFDKAVITREDLVQIFTTKFLKPPAAEEKPVINGASPATETTAPEVLPPGLIEELIAGVREQSELLVLNVEDRVPNGRELLSRVSSVASCAAAAAMGNLARQAKALENYLNQLDKNPQSYNDASLATVTRAVEVMSAIASKGSPQEKTPSKFSAVFIDESPPSNRAMEQALLKAAFEPACFEEPTRAREYLACHKAQIIMVNVALPEAHGLALADTRQLPLHTTTPVLFGPERTMFPPTREEMPGSALRLDKSSLLLTELVLKALNAIQAPSGEAVPQQPRETAKPAPVNRAAASLPVEDSFELFARAPRQAEAAPVAESVQSASPAVEANRESVRLNQLFAGAGIPSLPIFRAEAEPNPVDTEVSETPTLPVVTTDQTLIEEKPLEAFPFAALRAQAPPQQEQEPLVQDEKVPQAWAAETATAPSEDYLPVEAAPGFESPETAATPQPAEPITNDGEIMNTELLGLAEHKAQVRCAELEQEVAALREALEGLNAGFTEPQQSVPDLTPQIQELEQRLNEKAAELDKQKQEHEQTQADLRQELQEKVAANEKAETARQQAENRFAQLEQEVSKLRQAAEQAAKNGDAGKQQKNAKDAGASSNEPWSGLTASELEQQVRQGVAALAKATAELAKERGERQRAHQLATDLNHRLQTLHQDFSRTLHVQGEHLARITTLEQEHDQAKQAWEKCKADLEQHQAERASFDEEIQKLKDSNGQLRKDVAFFEEANRRSDAAKHELQNRLEASLNGAKENETRLLQETAERKRLADSLEATQRQLQEHARKREILEQELKTANEALQDREARLRKETAERQSLTEALDAAKHGSDNNPDRDLEFSKVQSALQNEQVERKRQESQMAKMRQTTAAAAHAARSLRTNMRRQIREPVENLVHSTRTLLELEMGDEQKKLAEAVLQDVLLVQTRLREPGAQADTAEPSEPAKAS